MFDRIIVATGRCLDSPHVHLVLVYSWPHQHTNTRPTNTIVASWTFIHTVRRRGIAVCLLTKQVIVCEEMAAALHAGERMTSSVAVMIEAKTP